LASILAAMVRHPPPPAPVSSPGPASGRAGGFVLVEVLLAAFILAVGLLGLAALQVAAERVRAATRARTVALALAASALERGQAGASGHDPDGRPVPGPRGRFTVTVGAAAGPAGTRSLRATVAWAEAGERSWRLERLRP